jgi:hypothetical protein
MQFGFKNLSILVAKPAVKKPSLDLFFQLMKENIANQESLVTSLDSKANNIMTVATSILTAALDLQAIILTIESSSTTKKRQAIKKRRVSITRICGSALRLPFSGCI